MKQPGENPDDKHKSGLPDWWPRGYAWSLLLLLFGFMLGAVIMLWLAVRLEW